MAQNNPDNMFTTLLCNSDMRYFLCGSFICIPCVNWHTSCANTWLTDTPLQVDIWSGSPITWPVYYKPQNDLRSCFYSYIPIPDVVNLFIRNSCLYLMWMSEWKVKVSTSGTSCRITLVTFKWSLTQVSIDHRPRHMSALWVTARRMLALFVCAANKGSHFTDVYWTMLVRVGNHMRVKLLALICLTVGHLCEQRHKHCIIFLLKFLAALTVTAFYWYLVLRCMRSTCIQNIFPITSLL